MAVRSLCWILLFAAGSFAQGVATKPTVKGVTESVSGTSRREGVVAEINDDGLTLVEVREDDKFIERTIVPIDVLRSGDFLPSVNGKFAYRWSDVKKGDTVELEVKKDRVDGIVYCLQICIHRRPMAVLPESQLPKDDRYFAARKVYNDIDNGLDVSEDELKIAFPPEFDIDRKTGEKKPVQPGVVYKEYMKKLDAIRAKKGKDLKATAPDKK
jgi:hypothetical protein